VTVPASTHAKFVALNADPMPGASDNRTRPASGQGTRSLVKEAIATLQTADR
jgi:hypothetical protein